MPAVNPINETLGDVENVVCVDEDVNEVFVVLYQTVAFTDSFTPVIVTVAVVLPILLALILVPLFGVVLSETVNVLSFPVDVRLILPAASVTL